MTHPLVHAFVRVPDDEDGSETYELCGLIGMRVLRRDRLYRWTVWTLSSIEDGDFIQGSAPKRLSALSQARQAAVALLTRVEASSTSGSIPGSWPTWGM